MRENESVQRKQPSAQQRGLKTSFRGTWRGPSFSTGDEQEGSQHKAHTGRKKTGCEKPEFYFR